ncbi:vitamin K epoxide reductase family protein [Calothrix sp. 336/3]|uniref:vitamin K epoxide reductase family protein n=1 Tax=Calothrix sp. 336/3 TaxID=1337936 RepID=UPI0004E42C5E|nr:vitamin K epoxide reductase family protein [Calothrix sp. 336/3]AKG21996.1 membrane protein [Calothrix sp. 336/3]
MIRRRSAPWIHRNSRYLIAGIAGCGALVTAYLTYVKFTQNSTACPTKSCDLVLQSPYATVLGQPLALFGFLAYTSMMIFALLPLGVDSVEKKENRNQLENLTWLLLLTGAVAMSVFSGYLMYVLFAKINAACIYCIGSAIFSLSLLILTIIGRTWEDFGQIFFTAIVVGMVTLIATLGVYSGVNRVDTNLSATPEPTGKPTMGVGWEIKSTSGEAEIALAKHLTQIGAKEYIAWWCPHCHEQKELFGKEAYKEIRHIECDPRGKNPQPNQCTAAGIEGFPTWQINGKLYPNVQSLNKLADISGYKGPRNFKNFPDAFK